MEKIQLKELPTIEASQLVQEAKRMVAHAPITQIEKIIPGVLERLDTAIHLLESVKPWPNENDLNQMWDDFTAIQPMKTFEKVAAQFAEKQNASSFMIQRFSDYVSGVAKGKNI
jgi:hypothetical protein